MIEKKTVLDQIEITRTGAIQVRLGSLLVDGNQELDCKLHRFVLEPGGDVAAMIAMVNTHLGILGRAELKDQAALSQLNAMVSLVHTPEIVAAHQARRKAEQDALDASIGGQRPIREMDKISAKSLN